MKITNHSISKILFSIFIIYFLNACQDGNLDTLEQEISLGALDIVSITVTAPAALDDKMPISDKLQFIATGTKSDGSTVDVTTLPTLTWSVSNTSVASIDNSLNSKGILSSFATAANVTVSANISTVVGNKPILISDLPLTSISVKKVDNNDPPSSISICSELQLKATGNYSDDFSWDVTNRATWIASEGDITTDGGLFSITYKPATPSNITASFDGVISSPIVEIDASEDLNSISISPVTAKIIVDEKIDLVATAVRTNSTLNNVITNFSVWLPVSSVVAKVSNTGEVTGVGIGTESITAECGTVKSAPTIVTVEASSMLKRIEVYKTKSSATTVVDKYITMKVGDTIDLKVDAFYANTDSSLPFAPDVEWEFYPLGDSVTPFSVVSVATSNDPKGRVTADSIGIGAVRVEYFDNTLSVALQDIIVIRVVAVAP